MSLGPLSLIMVTRNRPLSLCKCLGRTRAVLPEEVKIIVFDDASENAGEIRSIIKSHANTVYLRSENLVGPTGGRNACLRAATTRFCLCIDDDCYLDEVPDLSRWLENRREDRDIAVVGFRYFNIDEQAFAPQSDIAGPVKAFHGGASLLRREEVLKAGGYLDWLVFACEDTELALRLWRLNYRVWYDPSVTVQHARSDEGRDKSRGAFYYVRNTFLLNVLYGGNVGGFSLGFLRALRRGVFHTDNAAETWAGILAGLRLFPKCLRARKELFRKSTNSG